MSLIDIDVTALADAELLRAYFLCGDVGEPVNDAIVAELERRSMTPCREAADTDTPRE